MDANLTLNKRGMKFVLAPRPISRLTFSTLHFARRHSKKIENSPRIELSREEGRSVSSKVSLARVCVRTHGRWASEILRVARSQRVARLHDTGRPSRGTRLATPAQLERVLQTPTYRGSSSEPGSTVKGSSRYDKVSGYGQACSRYHKPRDELRSTSCKTLQSFNNKLEILCLWSFEAEIETS